MTTKDYVTDVAVGSVIGVASGGIGAGGSVLTQGASGVAKVGVRVGAGAVSGAVGGAISEGGRAVKGEEVTLESVGKSMGTGVVCGGIGGASSHIASNASKVVGNEVGKAAIRVGTQASSGAVVDAGMQMYEKKTFDIREVDPAKVVVAAGSQAVVAGAGEVGRVAGERTASYAEKVEKQFIREDFKDPKEAKIVEEMVKDSKDISKNELKQQKANLKEKSMVRKENAKLEKTTAKRNAKLESKIAKRQERVRDLKASDDPNKGLKIQKSMNKIKSHSAKIKENNMQKQNGMNKIPEKILIKEKNNFHFLDGDRKGQASMDLDTRKDPNQNYRSSERVILEKDAEFRAKTGRRFMYKGKVENHDFKAPDAAPKPGENRPVYDPHDALAADKFNSLRIEEDCEEEEFSSSDEEDKKTK